MEAEAGYSEYVWHKDGIEYQTTTRNSLIVTESGSYTVQVRRDCGLSGKSVALDVEIVPCSDLEVIKERTFQDDLDITFTVTVTNLNPHFTEPNATATELLPTGLIYVNSNVSKGNYNNVTGVWNIGSLAPDQSETLVIECRIGNSGEYINTATAKGVLEDTDLRNNKSSATVDAFVADIDAFKNDGKELFFTEEYLTYTIKVVNNGPQKALNVEVNDPMPHQTTEMTWEGNGKSGTGDLVDVINSLDVKQEIIYKVKLRVPKDHKGLFTNTVNISSIYIVDPVERCTGCADTNFPHFEIPRGISPNGDGENDYLDLSDYFASKLTIYNRYGNAVYTKDDYRNEWHGQDNNGKILPSGTYFYSVFMLGNPYKTGYIQVIKEMK